jgi:hypothetical protein
LTAGAGGTGKMISDAIFHSSSSDTLTQLRIIKNG